MRKIGFLLVVWYAIILGGYCQETYEDRIELNKYDPNYGKALRYSGNVSITRTQDGFFLTSYGDSKVYVDLKNNKVFRVKKVYNSLDEYIEIGILLVKPDIWICVIDKTSKERYNYATKENEYEELNYYFFSQFLWYMCYCNSCQMGEGCDKEFPYNNKPVILNRNSNGTYNVSYKLLPDWHITQIYENCTFLEIAFLISFPIFRDYDKRK
jgi:hypothetical protein